MSQYLGLLLKKEEITVSLGYFCTTPARQISDLGAFPYTEKDIQLDQSTIESYISLIREERDKYKEYLEKEISKKSEIKQNLYKCTSKEVAQMFFDNIEDIEQNIYDLKETITEWDWIITKLTIILDIWEENSKEWNLYYYNC